MKIEVKDYHDVEKREEYWTGREYQCLLYGPSHEYKKLLKERIKFISERRRLDKVIKGE